MAALAKDAGEVGLLFAGLAIVVFVSRRIWRSMLADAAKAKKSA